jgi:hypothetical protein
MESPERLIPSVVWVERMNTFLRLWPQTFYFSVEEGLCIFRGTVRNRERRGTSGSIASCLNHSTDRVVESTTEVLQSVTNDGGKFRGNTFDADKVISAISRIRIILASNAVWVASDKSVSGLLKLNDVLVGPI